jgi:hypothetical protein
MVAQGRAAGYNRFAMGCSGKTCGPSRRWVRLALEVISALFWAAAGLFAADADADSPTIQEARQPSSDAELRRWLANMVWYHHFSLAEIEAATGLQQGAISQALARFAIRTDNRPARDPAAPLLVLPYPGGRHPRIGFREGAIRPQRDTKFSVFLPWDMSSYVVVDLPEALWSNLGLTYLAHTHVSTIWTKANVKLERAEWRIRDDGLEGKRVLPNGIAFGARAEPSQRAVRMELWLHNGTSEPLSDLRVQNCVMLGAARGFDKQTKDNKVFENPYCAARSQDGRHWIVTAWQRCHRCWANERCPCLHSDPQFEDCPAGQTRQLRGVLSFYEGDNIQEEFARLEQTGWRNP